jgi:hypothetical protein
MCKRVTIALAVSAAILAGCGKSSTYKTKDGELTVNKKDGQVNFEGTSKDGKVSVSVNQGGVALPEGFPKDVPIYKGGVVQVASTQDKMMMVHLSLTASVEEALKYYQEQLKEQGWEIKSTMNMGEGSMLQAKKGERQCSAVIMKDSKGTMVQLTLTQEGS